MNLLLILIIAIITIIIGFFIGKYFAEQKKWSDKKKLIEEQWKSKLEHLQKDNELKLKEIQHNWELKYSVDLKEIKELVKGAEKSFRQDAVKRSRRTLLGQLWEQVSPYVPKFPFKPADMKFIGAPIDFIIFDGMGEKNIKQVIFLEIKSGKSTLNSQERKLKKVIESGKVIWKQFNVDSSEKIKIDDLDEKKEEDKVTPNELYTHIDDKISRANEKFVQENDE